MKLYSGLDVTFTSGGVDEERFTTLQGLRSALEVLHSGIPKTSLTSLLIVLSFNIKQLMLLSKDQDEDDIFTTLEETLQRMHRHLVTHGRASISEFLEEWDMDEDVEEEIDR